MLNKKTRKIITSLLLATSVILGQLKVYPVIAITSSNTTMKNNEVSVSIPDTINPLLPGYNADPTIHRFGDKYYIYATTTDRDFTDPPMVWSSDDMLNWSGQSLKMDVDEESYGDEYKNSMHWAPSVIYNEIDGLYYMYYTVYDQNLDSPKTANGKAENNIVAVADNPMGPFVIKRAITLQGPGGPDPKNDTHDPQAFTDPATGKTYLLYGGMYWKLQIEEIDPDNWTKTLGNPVELVSGSYGNPVGSSNERFGEGAYIYAKPNENAVGGYRYYLTYSDEGYSDSSYKVYQTYSDNGLFGTDGFVSKNGHKNAYEENFNHENPTDNIMIRSTNVDLNEGSEVDNIDKYIARGPGHHSVISVNDEDYIVYHKLASERNSTTVHRQTAIDRILYDENGIIKEIIPTLNANNVTVIENAKESRELIDEKRKSLSENQFSIVSSSSTLNSSNYPNTKALHAIDRNNGTAWQSSIPPTKDSPEWLQVDLGSEQIVTGFKTDFWLGHRYHQYNIEYSIDGVNWETYINKENNKATGTMIDEIGVVKARYVRVNIYDVQRYEDEKNPLRAGIWEFKVYGIEKEYEDDEIIGFKPLNIYTDENTIPKLPTIVTALKNNDLEEVMQVTWDEYDNEDFSKGGYMQVIGSVEGTEIKVIANIEIPIILKSINPVKVTTISKVKPKLPNIVYGLYNNDMEYPVEIESWDNIYSYKYGNEGEFDVKGTVKGTSLNACSKVTVLNDPYPYVPKDIRVIWSEGHYSSDSPDKAVDGDENTAFHTAGNAIDKPVIFDMNRQYNLDKLELLFRANGNGSVKRAEIYSSIDGENYEKVFTNSVDSGNSAWPTNGSLITVKFDKQINARYIKIVTKESIGRFFTMREFRPYKVNEEIIVEKPSNFEFTELTTNSVKLIWDEPKSKDSLIGYVVYKDGKIIGDTTSNRFDVLELKPNTIYSFKVASKYSNGDISKPLTINLRTSKL